MTSAEALWRMEWREVRLRRGTEYRLEWRKHSITGNSQTLDRGGKG